MWLEFLGVDVFARHHNSNCVNVEKLIKNCGKSWTLEGGIEWKACKKKMLIKKLIIKKWTAVGAKQGAETSQFNFLKFFLWIKN